MSTKKVSVIVPVYNVEEYIEKCLDSLVNQTLKDIEIIVVNDGSPDSSQKKIDKYVEKYPELVKSFIKENGGLSSARNFGLKYVSGEFISFVDSDDWLEEETLEEMYKKAKETNSDIVVCDMIEHYHKKTIYHNCTQYNSIFEVTPSACNKIFKKTLIKDLKFLEGIWYEDLNFTTKLMLNNPKISNISKGYYNCHCRENSIMRNNNSLKNLDIIIVFDDIIEYSKRNKLYDKNLISYLIFNHILILAINRVSIQKSNDKNKVIKKLIDYCEVNIKDYRKLSFYKNTHINKKIIAFLNYKKLYNVSKIILKIKQKVRK